MTNKFVPKPNHSYQTKREDLLWFLNEGFRSDLPIFFYNDNDHDDGWKLSIQAKSVEDSIFFIDNLYSWLQDNRISHKIATIKRYTKYRNNPKVDPEQSYKGITIYCPNQLDVVELGKEIHAILKAAGFNGWDGVNAPKKYTLIADGVYYRNDRDENKQYIKAN